MTPDLRNIDGAGLKFKIMRELGEDADISFIAIDKNEHFTHYFRGHEYSDGLGIWRDIYKKRYPECENFPDIPIARSTNKPWLLKRIFFFFSHIWRQRPRNYSFKKYDKNKSLRPSGFCYAFFDCHQTIELENFCKSHACSVNAVLINAADKTFKSLLKHSDQSNERVWMLPVNVRESHEKELSFGNFATALSIITDDSQTVTSLNHQIRSLLKSGIIWAGKWVAHFPRYLGIKRLKKMAKKNVKAPYLGLVSNLGSWGHENARTGCDDSFVIVPTVSKLAPISIAAITFNGRLSLGLHLHPSLCVDTHELKELASKMVEHIFSHGVDELPTVTSKQWDQISDNVDLNPVNN